MRPLARSQRHDFFVDLRQFEARFRPVAASPPSTSSTATLPLSPSNAFSD
jgi:hypothetical protein